MTTLSVLIPVYNEVRTIRTVVDKIRATGLADEIVLVDDGSADGTREILGEYSEDADTQVIFHERNAGKGAALRTAIRAAHGDIMLVQDADLEYDPSDYARLLAPFANGTAQVVYGSRFLDGPPAGIMRRSAMANRLLTALTNVLFRIELTDMETCYKVFAREAIAGIELRANRFDFEPELTAKLLKKGKRIVEVPISFAPRDYTEGKKIGAWDGIFAAWALLKYRFVD